MFIRLTDSLKRVLRKSQMVWGIRTLLSYYFENNRIKTNGRQNSVVFKHAFLKNSIIVIKGNNNEILIEAGSRFEGEIKVFGHNNRIVIGKECILRNTKLWIEEDGNNIIIGDYTTIEGNTELACIEGKKITLGVDCMLSSNISIKTGDSHSIIDKDGFRINASKDVIIGDHVWIGANAVILKGATIPSNCIIGINSIVNKQFSKANCVVAGIPASVVRDSVSWKRERI